MHFTKTVKEHIIKTYKMTWRLEFYTSLVWSCKNLVYAHIYKLQCTSVLICDTCILMSGIVLYMNMTSLLSSSREWLEETSVLQQVSIHQVPTSLDVGSALWAVCLSPYWSLVVDSLSMALALSINVTPHYNIPYKQTRTFVLIEDCHQWVLRCQDQPTFRDGLGTLSMLFSWCAQPETKRCHILWVHGEEATPVQPSDQKIFFHTLCGLECTFVCLMWLLSSIIWTAELVKMCTSSCFTLKPLRCFVLSEYCTSSSSQIHLQQWYICLNVRFSWAAWKGIEQNHQLYFLPMQQNCVPRWLVMVLIHLWLFFWCHVLILFASFMCRPWLLWYSICWIVHLLCQKGIQIESLNAQKSPKNLAPAGLPIAWMSAWPSMIRHDVPSGLICSWQISNKPCKA